MTKRPIFSSRIATVLTLIGIAVGLGNVWRFPYMMGKYGGSAFLFIYLGFTLLFAIPALTAEMALGRATQKGPLGAFSQVFGNRWGSIVGGIILFSLAMATSYYAVVIGNVLFTSWFSVLEGFSGDNIKTFELGLGRGWLQYGITISIISVSLFVISKGLKKGIEPLSKIFVPFFLIAIIYLIINALSLEGAGDKMLYFLKPDFQALDSEQIFAALGQTFFSVGLGGNFMIIFGSYLQKQENIPKIALMTATGDVSAALLSSLFIIPAILVFGLNMEQGPTLIFSTLPQLFMEMPGGRFVGSLFLISLSMVAFLSLVAALEVVVTGLLDFPKFQKHKNKIIIGVGAGLAVVALPSALNPEIIGTLDLIFGSGMMVFGSALTVIGFVWGLGKFKALNEIFGTQHPSWINVFHFWIKWLIPIALIAVLVGYIYTLF